MDLFSAICLGILQGLTEFFPVSSSGHLALFGHWLEIGEPNLTFDILVHIATLMAIVVYFRKDWIQLGKTVLGKEPGDLPKRVVLLLFLATLPAAVLGVLFKDHVAWFHGQTVWVGIFLLATGFTLLTGFKIKGNQIPLAQLTLQITLAMGFAQALAILPGISRAGATIMTAALMGMERRGAARFSFLMAVPVIVGAGLLEALDIWKDPTSLSEDSWLVYGAGFGAAAISGFFALAFLMRLLEGKRFFYFGFYCLGLGTLALLVS